MSYRRTQSVPALIFLVLVPFLAVAIAFWSDPDIRTPVLFGGLIGLVVAVTFSRLTVRVTGDRIHAAFGVGLPKRTIAAADVVGVRTVRNRWFHGWGVRVVPRGWMFNVWGLDAVELTLRSGRVFRIGTAEPVELERAITRVVGIRS